MRIPLLIIIPACILTVIITWWNGSKGMDFLSPPSEKRLAEIRHEVVASLPQPDKAPEPAKQSEPATAAPVEVKPQLDLGDRTVPPVLNEYAGGAENGADYLISLALALEAENEFPRALCAWERVIDHARPTDSQRKAAVSSIERLRPTLPDWNSDPAKAVTIVLHAGTGKKSAEMLKPHLDAVAKRLGQASSGVVTVIPEITASRSELSKSGASPVAVWFTGAEKTSPSTEVLSFTFEKADELPSQLDLSLFALIRAYLARNTTLTAIPELPMDQVNSGTLASSITRFAWKNLGVLLNRPDPNAPKEPTAKPTQEKKDKPRPGSAPKKKRKKPQAAPRGKPAAGR